jgi:hypothetical protein
MNHHPAVVAPAENATNGATRLRPTG